MAENLALPLAINGLPPDEARIDQLLHRLDMSHKRHAWPEQLSGGQRQRVALARALIHQPGWLLADEPTGSLDEHNAEQVMALMVAAVRDTGAGLLLVSHNPPMLRWPTECCASKGANLSNSRGPAMTKQRLRQPGAR